MDKEVYLNGRFVPRAEAKLDIEDRGSLFADGVYEVLRYYWGKPLAVEPHAARLRRSLEAIGMGEPLPDEVARFAAISDELVRRNGLEEAGVYWQISRGSAIRAHLIPRDISPTVLAIAYPAKPIDLDAPPRALVARLMPDIRWHRCDIKSLMLLPNVMAKTAAHDQGADEAILHRGDTVTEGSSTGVMIVQNGELWTHPANQWVLGSITRLIVLELAGRLGIAVHEKTFSVTQLLEADEVFICGTTTHVGAVVNVDGTRIGTGQPGPVTCRCYRAFLEHIKTQCGPAKLR